MEMNSVTQSAGELKFPCVTVPSRDMSLRMSFASDHSSQYRALGKRISCAEAIAISGELTDPQLRRIGEGSEKSSVVLVGRGSSGNRIVLGFAGADEFWQADIGNDSLQQLNDNSKLVPNLNMNASTRRFTPYSYGPEFQARIGQSIELPRDFAMRKRFCSHDQHFQELIRTKEFESAPCILGPVCILPRMEPEFRGQQAIVLWREVVGKNVPVSALTDALGATKLVAALSLLAGLTGAQRALKVQQNGL